MNEARVDRNIIDNILDLRKFGEDANLIKAVLFFFAWKQQNCLFDNSTLDPEEFCRVLSLKREHLVIQNPKAKHRLELINAKKLKSREDQIVADPGNFNLRIFDSFLENALYRLYSENLVFSGKTRTYKSKNGDTNIVEPLERIIFLSRLEARQIITKKGRKKIVYDYQLNESFIKNLSLYFSSINLNHFVALRKANIEDLYIYLKNLRETLASKDETSTSSLKFDFLCEIANIQSSENRDKKKLLIQKFNVLSQKIDFPVQLSFIHAKGARWAYVPVITFPEITIHDRPKHNKEQREQIFLQNFLRNLTEIIKTAYPNREPISEDFLDDIIAFCRTDILMQEKGQAYREAQLMSFVDPDKRYLSPRQCLNIPRALLEVKSIDEIKKIIFTRFD